MSEREIKEVFERILPSVAAIKRNAFLDGMLAYHAKWKKYREDSMNYQEDEQYQNEWVEIAVMDQEDYWLYSPQFSQVVGRVLNELFKTKIQYHSLPDPTLIEKAIVLIDKHGNRWLVSLRTPKNEPEKMRVCMRMPRTVSPMLTHEANMASENEVSAVNAKVELRVTKTSAWYD